MGIQGLIPFLKKASSPVNIRTFKGCTAAVDAYCWLHKGAFSCADKLVKGEPTDGYIHYCIKMVNTLLNAGIQPVMVFDGQRLPSKALTENKRHENRQKYKNKAKECLIKGDIRGARECFQRCTEVTSQMALEVIQACRKLGVDCIVAPYEADAQLAYLCEIGISQVVITEDSDLVLFGCKRIIFKMDAVGNGILVERSKLHLCLGLKAENFTFDKFRYMCIMSGCDYLPSLHGIGLGKALKFFSKTTNPNLEQVLGKIPVYLNMSTVTVTKEYITNFLRANQTFLFQLVYDPLKRKLVPLNPYPPELNPDELDYAGPRIADQLAYQIALGNVSVDSLKKVDNFNPDCDRQKARKKKSIWDRTYTVQLQPSNNDPGKMNKSTSSVSNKGISSVTLSTPKQFSSKTSTLKRAHSDEETLTDECIIGLYGNVSVEEAKRCKLEPEVEHKSVEIKSPPSVLPPTKIVQSRYFASPPGGTKNVDNVAEVNCKTLTPTTNFRTRLTTSPVTANVDKCSSQSPTTSEQSTKSPSIGSQCLNRFQDTQEISIRDGTTARQRGGSLFFDTAVASKNPSYAAKTPAKQESPISANSRRCGNFGDWSSLRSYFSHSALHSISKSPKNHTEFKQVVRHSNSKHDTDCHIKLSQNSQTSTSSSSSQASHDTLLGTQSSETNSATNEPTFELKDILDENDEEHFVNENMEVDNILTQDVTTSPKKAATLALTTVEDTNDVSSCSRSSNTKSRKLGMLPARKHLGPKKQKSPIGSKQDITKQSSIKELFSKFSYVKSK